MIDVRTLSLTEALYTFTTHEGDVVHIAASTLLEALEAAKWPVTRCYMDTGLIGALERGDLGVESTHALGLPQEALNRPGIIGEWGGAHISIDGAHRLWRRWQAGLRDFPAYVVPEPLWRVFQVSGIPGSAAEWREWNKTAEIRTPEMAALLKLLEGVL